ncbi:hypothetical protein [Rhodococcus tukisamuensis]|uniref:Uncharacterized protein n=1 Tax=Rhodococcus tukisamuensis TaxID=168276 RepID=A0A1G6VJ12_9NOCA|nr:hypothetical protein [Rhodococcus tukisamuensis]SDD53027.1 hypothetical protein SAMN05444580_1059 [Rhodococcus tukisamuensis]
MIVATLQPAAFDRGHDADPPDVMRGTDRDGDHGGVTDDEAGTERTGESDAPAGARIDFILTGSGVAATTVLASGASTWLTDTMPLSRWAKALTTSQALVPLVVAGLVAARAVNILPGD